MTGTTSVITRSMLTKLIDKLEVGKLLSLLSTLEIVVALVMDPTYSMLYRFTVEYFAGSFMFFSAALTIATLPIFLYERQTFSCHIRGLFLVSTR
jgi:hypothetical protein